MSVTVHTTDGAEIETTPAEMAQLAGETFPVTRRVPETPGEGFDLAAWFAALMTSRADAMDSASSAPTHLIVKASDDFQAVIPWDQLNGAFFQYSMDGTPLPKGGPLRLYVPDGTSACLNVKNVTFIRFVSDPEQGGEASYGFRNEISPARLSQGFRAGNAG